MNVEKNAAMNFLGIFGVGLMFFGYFLHSDLMQIGGVCMIFGRMIARIDNDRTKKDG